ncbi:prenyltransferase/squalene oxidase repeat-containing protein [Urbifossiella limnaea]|uniref:Prenyltransferase and squalene oxidase repeat protein n=1 Tax=Urbifossiella limnaea TaxID=2528023 RepID=A0A517Y0B2_9BACT|nr:prenyltransferase/squalene oxidase repeat-containing protein [Urbifossiella limnaea]QDU23193.1 Prenyltransferase and squalene oxidase repeat protein [Urbifossiella limnaea]
MRTTAALLAALVATLPAPAQESAEPGYIASTLRGFFANTARPDGSFRPGIDPAYEGMSDSAFSDLAPVAYAVVLHKTFGWKLPDEAKTREFLLGRQRDDGSFFNVAGTVGPDSAAGRAYNTTMAVMALKALNTKPRRDPLPVFDAVLKTDYKELPAYMTSFFPLAYLASGKAIPPEADRKIKALMEQDADGYLHDHVAATFHAAHYYRLIGEPVPRGEAMLARVLRDQKPDGSWMLNPPARDRHATFDAVFVVRQLGGNRPAAREALRKAASWSLTCRNRDGGFGHYPGSPSDADACFFHAGTLVMAGYLKPVEPLPPDARLLGWGHLFPVSE